MKKFIIFAGLIIISVFTFSQNAPSHQAWDKLLKKHVNKTGMVNYKGFLTDRSDLTAYLKTLSDNAPGNNWSKDDQKAYWINAYNAFTIELILNHYPVKSIKDIGGSIYKVNTAWDKKFITIGGKKYDLNNIEHGILRKKFDDARIHFALVCASISCPRLRDEAYTGSNLSKQLDDAGKEFLSDKSKNKISSDKAELSKYFTWYKGDFKKNGTLLDYLNQYSPVKLNANAKISYLDYNWGLNEQK